MVKFARIVFAVAGIIGLLELLPFYFQEASFSADFPPAIAHPEFFYGFIGVAAVWQLVFFVIATNPLRYRPIMGIALLEKAAFAIPAYLLWQSGRLTAQPILAGATVDALMFLFFAIAFVGVWRSASQKPV